VLVTVSGHPAFARAFIAIIPSFFREANVVAVEHRFSRGSRSRDSLVSDEWTQLPQPKRGVFGGVTLFRFSLLIAYRD